jgi:hypothetical protein
MAQGLPEETGIGALPVPEMKHMAAGGIVAFSGKGESLVRSYTGGRDYFLDVPATIRDPSVPYYQEIQNPLASLAGRKFNSREEAVQAYDAAVPAPAQDYQSGPQLRSPKAKNVATMPTDDTRRTDSRFPSGVAALTPVSAPVGQRGTPTPTGANLAPSAGAMSIADLQKLQASLMPKGDTVDPYAEQGETIGKLRAEQGQAELTDAEARKAGLASLFDPKAARIKEREERLNKRDDLNLNMSLINAGLAMMQSRGQGLSGIAEGAGVGVKQYTEGLQMSEAARQKLEDAKDAFDELRFNQTNMSQKEITAAKGKIADGAIATKSEGIKRLMDERNINRTDANKVFEATVTAQQGALDRASRERTAAFSAQVQKEIASMPGAQEKLFATLGGGDAKKGFAYFTKETNEGRGDQALLKAYIANPAMMDFLDPDTKKAFQMMLKAQMVPGMVPGMVSGAPNAGQVRAP